MTFFRRLLAWIVTRFYSLYSRTYRVEFVNDIRERPETAFGKPVIYGHWHEDDLTLIGPHRHSGYEILISLSRDGDLLAYAMEKLGYRVIRGSSSRGGARGLIRLIRHVRRANQAIITVDGPRGPRRKVKPGIVMLAAKSGAPIVTLAAAAHPRFVFRGSWSKTYLPAPFAKVVIVYHESVIPAPSADDPVAMEACRTDVEKSLFRLHREAVRRATGKDIGEQG